MSPRVAKFWNLEVFVYTRDHKPAHLHVIGPDVDVKIEICGWKVVRSRGLSAKSLKRLVLFLQTIEKDLWEVWNEIHE